jgi:hypothetical protein
VRLLRSAITRAESFKCSRRKQVERDFLARFEKFWPVWLGAL